MGTGSKLLSIIMSMVLTVGLCPGLAFAGDAGGGASNSMPALAAAKPQLKTQADSIASGTWGTCPWEISSDGALTIGAGTGGRDKPWSQYKDSVVAVATGGTVILAEDCGSLFYEMKNLKSADLSGFDTSRLTSIGYMFFDCPSLTTLDVSGWDTSSVTSMDSAFWNCRSLTAIDVANWDVSKVTNMDYAFEACLSLATLDVSKWDTSSVERMSGTFGGCSSLASIDVSNWDTSNVTSMHWMFGDCPTLTSLNLSSFETSKVTDMGYMFDGCSALESLDLGSFDASRVKEMSRMFYGCSKLKTVFASEKWSTVACEGSEQMFTGCSAIVGGAGTVYDDEHVDAEYARVDATGAPGYFTSNTSISAAIIEAIPRQAYTGSALTPVVTVTLGGKALVRGTDYTVAYSNNVNVGTATVTVTGAGDYEGSKTVTFNIVAASQPGQQGLNVSAPHVVEDESMSSGQKATWDCVWFGSYPQEVVSDADVVSALDAATWSGNRATVGGVTYQRLYKSDATYDHYFDGFDSVCYGSDGCLYFKCSPVKWRVLETDGSTALLLADQALDCQRYDGSNTSAAWEACSLRPWLNSEFVDTAFTSAQRFAIQQQALVNEDNDYYGTSGGGATIDDVFLLALSDVCGDGAPAHGFVSDYSASDEARCVHVSDFACAMGGNNYADHNYQPDSGPWWLRSPGEYTRYASYVLSSGHVDRIGISVDIGYIVVRPALRISLSSDQVSYAGTVSSDGTITQGSGGNASAQPEKTSISGASIAAIPNQFYTGSALTPDISVTLGGKTLVRGTDYTVSYSNNVNVGTATVTVTGAGDYEGTKTATFNIVAASQPGQTQPGEDQPGGQQPSSPSAKTDIAGAVIAAIPDQSYTGSAVTPPVSVTYGGRALAAGTDYTVSYVSNVEVGTAAAIVVGAGSYEGAKTAIFNIVAAEGTPGSGGNPGDGGQTQPGEGSQTQPGGNDPAQPGGTPDSGSGQTPGEGGKPGDTGAGDGTSGGGSGSNPAALAKTSIANAKVTLAATSFTYDGKAKEPSATVTLGAKTLASGADYTLAYASNVDAGTATATVTGAGAYDGTASATFQIAKAANPLKVSSKAQSVSRDLLKRWSLVRYPITVKRAQGEVTFAKKSGSKRLTVDKERGSVIVKKGTKAGTYKVTVRAHAAGDANYEPASKMLKVTVKVPSADEGAKKGGSGSGASSDSKSDAKAKSGSSKSGKKAKDKGKHSGSTGSTAKNDSAANAGKDSTEVYVLVGAKSIGAGVGASEDANAYEYSYNSSGLLEKVADKEGSRATLRYADGLLTKSTHESSDGAVSYTRKYRYAEDGLIKRCSRVGYYYGPGKAFAFRGKSGRVARVLEDGEYGTHTYDLTYGKKGLVSKVVMKIDMTYTRTFGYDARGNITWERTVHWLMSSNRMSDKTNTYKNAYDKRGNLRKRVEKIAGATGGKTTYKFTYKKTRVTKKDAPKVKAQQWALVNAGLNFEFGAWEIRSVAVPGEFLAPDSV